MRQVLLCVFAILSLASPALADGPIRVLFVGGDWKSQITNYKKSDTPLRGHFVQQQVDRVAPGKFQFTLWTSYEFLQYGEAATLKNYDVIVIGDVMGQSVMPRLAEAVSAFVNGGGGLWYCDNHKAFTFPEMNRSFDEVLPVETVPFHAAEQSLRQPISFEKPLNVKPVTPDHPILKGLDFTGTEPLKAAHYGKVKPNAVILATTPTDIPIWIAWDHGEGRSLFTGGFFANDEASEQFCKWKQIGQFYVQSLTWLAAKAHYPRVEYASATAEGELTIDPTSKGSTLTAKHFGIHGQEAITRNSGQMTGENYKLYQALNLQDTFARTSAFMAIRPEKGKERFAVLNDGTDLDHFDPAKYDFSSSDAVLADLNRIQAQPIFLYWVPWMRMAELPDEKLYTKYFSVAADHVNGYPPAKNPPLVYYEIMNEPNLSSLMRNGQTVMTHEQVFDAFINFFNNTTKTLAARHPELRFGAGGFHEWPYVQKMIAATGSNLAWVSRHPYGHTGEAVFYLQDKYDQFAREHGRSDLKTIITEWDFWVYGEPAFDYLMQRWKPLADHADTVIGSLQYRWREYQEGGYVFGVVGESDKPFGELPNDWPNPGKDKPITYRYDAFWLMRNVRGQQSPATLAVPALQSSASQHAYAIVTNDGTKFNIVLYYGYPYSDPTSQKRYDSLKIHVRVPVPASIKGRTLTISRGDARRISEEPPRTLSGNDIDMQLDLPSLSGLTLTVQ